MPRITVLLLLFISSLSCNNNCTIPISPLNGLQKGIWETVRGSDKIPLISLLKTIPEDLDLPAFFEPPVFFIANDTVLKTFDNSYIDLEISKTQEKGWYLIYQKLEYPYISNWQIEKNERNDTLKFSFKDNSGKTIVLSYTNTFSKSETDLYGQELANYLHQSSWIVKDEYEKISNLAFKRIQTENSLYLRTVQNSIADELDTNFIDHNAKLYQLENILLLYFHNSLRTYHYLYGVKFINSLSDSISLLPINKDFDKHNALHLKKDSLTFKELDFLVDIKSVKLKENRFDAFEELLQKNYSAIRKLNL